ncbi:MAG: FG-GAP-like repeat-containing protein [Candidatus Eisenbacteria bacterium]
MRRQLLLLAILLIAAAAPAAARASEALVARRALTPAQAAEAARRGHPWTGPLLTPDQTRAGEARTRQWRSVPHLLSAPGVDWSMRARRRRGWTPSPAAAARNPQTRLAANAPERILAGPPDTIRVAFIRVDFLNDRAGDQTTGNGRFVLDPADSVYEPVDRPPHDRAFYQSHLEALARYYDAQSYGRVVVVGDVWPRANGAAYHCTDLADFGPWKFSTDIYPAAVHMFRTMFFAADSQSIALGDRIPWDTYDRFDLIHAGSDFQSDIRQDSPLDIPSFTLGVADTDMVIFPDSTNIPIDRASLIPETNNQDGYYGTLNGVIAHENGHNFFGFADLYNVDTGFPVVGEWSLMDSGNLAGSQVQLPSGDIIYAVGLLPPSVDPFQRFFIGDALAFRDVSWGDTLAVQNGERFPDMRRLWQSSDEYLLIENRYLTPSATVNLDQDSTTRVILGPKNPDRYEYDALLPGTGLLVWHIDVSVIPFETAFRYNSDGSFNTNPSRLGISVIEADKLADIGDPGSPFILGAPYDPYFHSNNPILADTTLPNLRPHIGTLPHSRIDFTDEPGSTMHLVASHDWALPGWPVAVDFPREGPQLLAIDVDGDGHREVCWAGGGDASPDSAALFAVRVDGTGLNAGPFAFAQLDTRPLQPLAAVPIGTPPGPGLPTPGPSLLAATTRATGPDLTSPGGRVWLVDKDGNPYPGWPATLPSLATTPPVIAGTGLITARVFVGCADGHVYQMSLDGTVVWASDVQVSGGVRGRLAVSTSSSDTHLVAFGGGDGDIGVSDDGPIPVGPCPPNCATTHWIKRVGSSGFAPDFLWVDFDGNGHPAGAGPVCGGGPTLVAHWADRLWAFCPTGEILPGWGQSVGDTLVAGLATADVDADGYAEVLAQSYVSGVAYWNQTGSPSPGWPRRATREQLRSRASVLAADVDGDGRSEMVTFNGSGMLFAVDGDGRVPEGWPLSLGGGASGSAVIADLWGDAQVEIVAPDRYVPDSLRAGINGRFGTLYAYTLPAGAIAPGGGNATRNSLPWPMLGGDPGRSSALPAERAPQAAASAGGPYVPGSLKAYPNPARNHHPVSLAFQLTEPARVDVDIVDTSGHRVASFSRDGQQADNLAVWDPGHTPAGLYLARVHMHGAGGEHTEVISIGVIQ